MKKQKTLLRNLVAVAICLAGMVMFGCAKNYQIQIDLKGTIWKGNYAEQYQCTLNFISKNSCTLSIAGNDENISGIYSLNGDCIRVQFSDGNGWHGRIDGPNMNRMVLLDNISDYYNSYIIALDKK